MDPPDFPNMLNQFLQSKVENCWIVDPRVMWDDQQEEFGRCFEDCSVDLLATQIRTFADDPDWYWWPSLRSPNGENPLTHAVAALLPLVRLSRRAAEAVLCGLEEGWRGHFEALIPTLVNRAGLLIEDIGGGGQFTPDERIGRWYNEHTWRWTEPVKYVPGKLHFPLNLSWTPKPLIAAHGHHHPEDPKIGPRVKL